MAISESAVEFGPDGRLSGILSGARDQGSAESRVGVVFLNAGIVHRIGPHRLHVKLSRVLAEKAVPCLRFDLSGLGESAPSPPDLDYDSQVLEDAKAAIDFICERADCTNVIIVGMCSGADNGYRVALADDRVVGLVLLDPYAYANPRARVERTIEKASDLKRWKRFASGLGGRRDVASAEAARATISDDAENDRIPPPVENFGGDLEQLARRNVRILIRYTDFVEEELTRAEHFFDTFKAFDFRRQVEVDVDRSTDHNYTLLSAQERLTQRVVEWFAANFVCDTKASPVFAENTNARSKTQSAD